MAQAAQHEGTSGAQVSYHQYPAAAVTNPRWTKPYVQTHQNEGQPTIDIPASNHSEADCGYPSDDPTELYIWACFALIVPLIGCIALCFYGMITMYFAYSVVSRNPKVRDGTRLDIVTGCGKGMGPQKVCAFRVLAISTVTGMVLGLIAFRYL